MPETIIYSTPVCGYCQQAKDYFTKHNVPYTEYDVASDTEKRQEMIDISGQMGVPVIRIGDDVVVGFDEQHLAKLLKLE